MEAYLSEIMSSIQGEGTKIGFRQVFIRFAGCNLKCGYCDTEKSLTRPEECRLETKPGFNSFTSLTNPLSCREVIAAVSGFNLSSHHSISLTGGEPLLYSGFIGALIPLLREVAPKLKYFLETNGTLPHKLAQVIANLDIISMDMKIPSTSGLEPIWEKHEEFLQVASAKEVYVKIVISDKTTVDEIETAAAMIQEAGRDIPLILQPITVSKKKKDLGVTPAKIFSLQEQAAKFLDNVRVIPQTHLFMGLL